ncbi:hypothetical protein [Sutterella wadsworthensis]|uniref:hypothetical protein n=1 Tax=Sutterella wadsworthensis TaxID=40545 RepID=UPI0013F65E76|nr:hypothetical protein [Sutterella wadsworthensis]
MSNTNPLVAQLIKLLPFLGRNVCYSDRELAMKRFRRMLAEQPNAFLDAYDAAIAEIRKIYPHESADLIDSAALSELEDQAVAETKSDGTTIAVYAAGFFAYGLENQSLASELLEPEDGEKLRELLYREYFDESNAQIRIYEHLIPLNHLIIANPDESQRFLEVMATAKSHFVPTAPSVDYPGVSANYDEEDDSDIAARFRVVLFTVKQKDASKPMQKTPFRFNGFAVPKGENISLSNDMILATPWGAEFSALISRRCGRGLRYAVTEPYLLNDTVRQLDYVVGLKRVMVAFTRTALDANVNPEDLIVSFGAFTDPVRGYSELRVAFALPSAPDELINGVPIPLPSPMTEQSAEELAKLVRASFEFEGIHFRHPVGELCPLLVAEPDSMDRLYNSIHNLQRPLIKPDSTPKPSIPSMLLN